MIIYGKWTIEPNEYFTGYIFVHADWEPDDPRYGFADTEEEAIQSIKEDHMQTKYVITRSGKFALCNENTGLTHPQILQRFLDNEEATSAGFAYMENGQFRVYGRSTGLQIASDPFAADAINRAVENGELLLLDIFEGETFIAANCGDGESVEDIAVLFKKKILID